MQINANSLSLQAVNFISMNVFTTKHALQKAISAVREVNSTLGFVPTMGALHEGHLSLIQTALEENELVVVSIFVNPTQFNNSSDLEHYPRSLALDKTKLESLGSSKILIYAPEVDDVYGEAISTSTFDFGGLEAQMEGKFRPGHFDGVGTVVHQLFKIVSPDFAYFGEKDFQQLAIINKLVELTQSPVQIVGCPIARAENGLALSSRNARLSLEEQGHAAKIFAILKEVKQKFDTKNANELKEWVNHQFDNDAVLSLEYFEISDEITLKPMRNKQPNTVYRAFIAVHIRDVRLIDNIALN